MTRHSRGIWQSFLLLPLLIYLLLPFFGNVWHDVVPEHDHVFLNPHDESDTVASHWQNETAPDACAACGVLASSQTVVHAYNPVSTLQVFGIAVSLCASLVLVLPRGLSMRVIYPTLLLRAARPAPLDPPPMPARFLA